VTAPAATVILLRDSAAGPEALLLRRNSTLAFHGGAWVFPGGRVDAGDNRDDGDQAAARRAAAREAREEAGIEIDSDALIPFSHWTTPAGRPRRFATWFFIGAASTDTVRVDGGEIQDHAWLSPSTALLEHGAGRIELPPPTFVTLTTLRHDHRVVDALTRVREREPPIFVPRIVALHGMSCALYPGDAGWDARDPELPGPRHRLLMRDGAWSYVDAPT